MNEQIFFMIDGKELVLDKVLVEFNEAPIFFVCKFEQSYFISSCVDMENERYLVAQVRLGNLSKMLHGKITMRDFILQAKSFWEITVGEDFSKDIVKEKSAETILLDELPYEGEYLTLATKDLREYAEKIDAILYGGRDWDIEIIGIVDGHAVTFEIERYKVALQNSYERFSTYAQKLYSTEIDKDVYNKEICNDRIIIDTRSTTNGIVNIDNNENRLWAA